MPREVTMLALVLMLGCTGNDNYTYSGYPMPDFFTFDGDRSWTFANADQPNTVVATLNTEPEIVADGAYVYDVDYELGCPEDLDTDGSVCTSGEPFRLSKIRWSSDASRGTLIHAFDDASGTTTFDPPLVITAERGVVLDQWPTDTTGGHFVSTFVELGDCPIVMTADWDECVHLRLDDDGDEATPGTHPLHGDWYAVAGFNVIAFQLTGDAARWELAGTTFSPL